MSIDLFGNDIPKPKEGETCQNVPPANAASPPIKLPRTPMDEIERTIVRKLQTNVTFVPGSSHKRFILRLTEDSRLSDGGRNYLAYVANRYRRQWKCTHEEFCWIVQWCRYGAIPEVRQDGVL